MDEAGNNRKTVIMSGSHLLAMLWASPYTLVGRRPYCDNPFEREAFEQGSGK